MLGMAAENIFREKIARISSIRTWIYIAARNCTARRVDRTLQAALFLLRALEDPNPR
jgi:hypothetical protein